MVFIQPPSFMVASGFRVVCLGFPLSPRFRVEGSGLVFSHSPPWFVAGLGARG